MVDAETVEKTVWLARDRNGDLFAFRSKPYRRGDEWFSSDGVERQYDPSRLKSLTWDDEPVPFTIKINQKINNNGKRRIY